MDNDDDISFWNESSHFGRLNFFDDDEDNFLSDTDTTSFTTFNTIVPIHSIISNKSLVLILDDANSISDDIKTPEDAVRTVFLNQKPSSFGHYRSLESKLELLDSSIKIGDGNIIISVIIFLRNSLKRNIFYTSLSKRKVAIKHFSNYLIEKNNYEELADFYMATGNVSNLKDIYYFLCKDICDQQKLCKKLEQLMIDHVQNLIENKVEIQDTILFLKWQMEKKLNSGSIIDALINLSKLKWDDNVLLEFKKKFKLEDFQFDWVLVNMLCKMNNWEKLISSFIKTARVIKKRSLKSSIRADVFVLTLGKYKPPGKVLELFLPLVGDVDRCLHLAEKFGCHVYLINYYKEQKDRTSLLQCLSKVETGSEEFHLINSALNSEIKWKN